MSFNRVDFKSAKNIYEFTARDIKGDDVPLEKYRGHVCIIVNVASQCPLAEGYYEELNKIFEEYGESKGLKILAFPCDQFAHMEPGTNEEICNFIAARNVQFDIFDKIKVNGDDAHPLWKYLKVKKREIVGHFVEWNFTKFIVDKEGQVVDRWMPIKTPLQMIPALEKYF